MNRPFWILIGAIIAVSLISIVGFASAHFGANSNANPTANAVAASDSAKQEKSLEDLDGMQCGMHSGNGMHSMQGMECMNLSIEEMDKDNDGLCDYCGMPVNDCQAMKEMHGNGDMQAMHARMHNKTANDGSEMPCGMNNNNGMHSNGGMMSSRMHSSK